MSKRLNTHFTIPDARPLDERVYAPQSVAATLRNRLQRMTYREPESPTYRAVIERDSGPNVFRWHWPRGTFRPRMSAYEIAEFVLPHMQAIIGMGLLGGNPDIEAEFDAIRLLLAASPKSAIDRLLPWIKSFTRNEEDDVIEMRLDAVGIETGPTYFV